jgi:1-acyl-sn-glycerol-3-phosphate acyltransferase
MSTWRGADPPELPPATPAGRLAGLARLAAFLAMTAVLFPLFLAGRVLRHWLGHGVTFHFHIARAWSGATLRLLGLAHVVRGTPVHAGALVANHCSWIDIPALRAVGLIYFVAKAEVRAWPVVGYITHACGTIFIERRRTEARRQEEALRSRIAHDQRLLFFPEGTSTDGRRVLSFKSSLFSVFFRDRNGEADGEGADLLVQPVTIRYLPPPGLPPSLYAWWGDMDLGAHVWAVMSRSFGGRAEVIFHDPVNPRDFPDRKALARHCHAAVAEGLKEELEGGVAARRDAG